MVKTADGYKAIAHIQTGEHVFAKDETSGKTGYKPVTARYGNPYQETVYIEVSDGLDNSQTLISNRIHPFYSDGKWIKAEDLKAGSRLFAENGAEQTVQSITVKPEPLQAYNLTVADWHTYFVKGSQAETEGVWVHNDCPYDKGNQRYKDASYHGKNDNSVKSRAPTNGQAALDNSVQVKSTSPRRVGVDKANNEIVV
ncbi:polymorphic toxin MafB class 1, partial [Neisseria meningitidis]